METLRLWPLEEGWKLYWLPFEAWVTTVFTAKKHSVPQSHRPLMFLTVSSYLCLNFIPGTRSTYDLLHCSLLSARYPLCHMTFTLALPTLNPAHPLGQTLYSIRLQALCFNFLTYLDYGLNYGHQHTHFHQSFGLLYGLANSLFSYSLMLHSNGLHFPWCQVLLESVSHQARFTLQC